MSSKIKLIRALFAEGIDKIDAGNSNMTEEEENQVIEIFQTINDEKISKYQARQILNNMPASTFDKLVRDGKSKMHMRIGSHVSNPRISSLQG